MHRVPFIRPLSTSLRPVLSLFFSLRVTPSAGYLGVAREKWGGGEKVLYNWRCLFFLLGHFGLVNLLAIIKLVIPEVMFYHEPNTGKWRGDDIPGWRKTTELFSTLYTWSLSINNGWCHSFQRWSRHQLLENNLESVLSYNLVHLEWLPFVRGTVRCLIFGS